MQNCGQQEITSIRLSAESQLFWKNHFHKNPQQFLIIALFESDIEIDNCSICNKTTEIYKQNPVLKVYFVISELIDIL